LGSDTINNFAILTNPAILAWINSCCNRGGAMGARLRSWRQQIKQHRVAIGVVAIVLIVIIVLIIIGYLFDWTGFNGYNKVTITHTISGTNAGTVTKTEQYQPGKGLWDWLQLLIIPAVLAVAGYAINLTISRGEQAATKQRALSEREAADKRAETEREIALDSQREAALQSYIDKMAELMLHENFQESTYDSKASIIARARTLTVLPRLDGRRKGDVIQFLYDANLVRSINLYGIDLNEAILPYARLYNAFLDGAQLHNACLIEADLSNAILYATDLSGANLSGANLSEANICNADLRGANLGGAIVTTEQLASAKSLKGATMPDGSIHP
jgi:hypothetical protein